MKNPPPFNTRKSPSHMASQMSNQSGINENVATRDIPAKVTGESSEGSNHEAACVDTLGISSSPRKKHKGMKRLRRHMASQISNKSDFYENVAIRGCSNLEAHQTGCNELPPAILKFRVSVTSDEGINLFVDLSSHSSDWAKKLKSEVCIHPEMLNASSRVLHRELGVFEECEEQTKESFLGTKAVKWKTADDPKVIESFPSSVVRDLPEENIRSSPTIPKNIAESSLVRESPKVSSLCHNNSQNSVDLSSDSHRESGNVTSVSDGSKVSDISENGSRSDSECPSVEAVPMPTLVSCKPDLPIVSKFCEDQTPLITSAFENPGGVTPPPSEPPCPEPLVEEQAELVNNLASGSALLSDIQLDNGIQYEPPRLEPPFEDQVELVNNSYLGSASQPDIQLHNGIQSEPPCPEPLVEDQVELVNYSASGSASQPDIQLDNGIRYGHITSQLAEDPTQQPASEEHAELPSHDVVAPLRAMLQLPMSIGRSLGGSGPSGTCVSDSRSMGGVPDSINHPRQSAPMTSSRTSQSLLHHDSILNESVSIRKERNQVGLVINSASHPNTQLDYGIQSGHNTSQQAEFPTQPATTEEHSRLPSYNDALQDTMLQLPVGGSVTRVSDFRSLGVVPDCISHPLQIAPMPSSQTLLQDDPLLYELTRLRQELEQAVKFHEQLTMRIRFDFYKEIQEINKKYSKLHHDNDTALARTKKSIHTNYNKVLMNALLAKYYREKLS